MLRARSLKKIAMVTVFVFAWINLAADFCYAQTASDQQKQAQAQSQNEQYKSGVQAQQKSIGENSGKSNEAAAAGEPANVVEKQAKDPENKIVKKKKKFPLLLLVGGIVVVGVLAYLLLKKAKKYTLTVSKGAGVSGSPESGSYEYKKGSTVNYSYSLLGDYKNLVVKLDGQAVSSSGSITMGANHDLTVTAEQKATYNLIVTKGTGVSGTPNTGTTAWQEGQVASYSYTLQSGYKELVVKLDNVAVAESGTITMNGNHTLKASASVAKLCKLEVICEWMCYGVESWKPSFGTHYYYEGTVINCKYTSDSAHGLEIWINGVKIFKDYSSPTTYSGSFIITKDTVMSVNGI